MRNIFNDENKWKIGQSVIYSWILDEVIIFRTIVLNWRIKKGERVYRGSRKDPLTSVKVDVKVGEGREESERGREWGKLMKLSRTLSRGEKKTFIVSKDNFFSLFAVVVIDRSISSWPITRSATLGIMILGAVRVANVWERKTIWQQ